MALVMTTACCGIIIIFAMQTKYDLTRYGSTPRGRVTVGARVSIVAVKRTRSNICLSLCLGEDYGGRMKLSIIDLFFETLIACSCMGVMALLSLFLFVFGIVAMVGTIAFVSDFEKYFLAGNSNANIYRK